MRPSSSLALLLLAALPAQELRHAVAAADLVVIATDVGVQPIGRSWIVHRLRVDATLRGSAPAHIAVVELRGVGVHAKPAPAESRLYCLRDFAREATRAELPPAQAPYYKMQGQPGSNPPVAGEQAPECALARAVLAAEAGRTPRAVNDLLLELVLQGRGQARLEAVKVLTEYSGLLAALDPLQLSDLTARAAGETEDVPYKIALAELAAERQVPGLVDALCLSADSVADPRFPQALGRIAGKLHGEEAAQVLQAWVARARGTETRARLLLALGATATDKALDALLQLKARGADPAVDAALRAHGAPRALAAVEGK